MATTWTSIDAKVQFFAYQRVRDAVLEHKAKGRLGGGAGRTDRRGAGPGQLPELRPGSRTNLTGEQLRNRAMTDVFEPGSTMKPFVAALALETHRVTPETIVDTGNGNLTRAPSSATPSRTAPSACAR